MPTIPDSNSATSKLGIAKFALSAASLIGGIVFAAFGNIPVAIALFTVAGQGGLSGMIGMKAADSK
jgi:hypothetical protein